MAKEILKEWTVMVYMAGDNNLSIDMVYALEQLKQAADQNKNINLLVYFDGYSSYIPTLYCDFSDCSSTNYFRSYNLKDKLIKRKNDFNENSASVNNVINFVDWCVNKVEFNLGGKKEKGRKARNYALIFSGHSFGFQSEGLFKDEKANYSMNLSKLRWMFERITLPKADLEKLADSDQNWDDEVWSKEKVVERTTEIIGKPLALLGFDSCVMSMLEVGCQFKNISETMVASEGSIPNSGWSYAQILLDQIGNNKNSTSQEIAASFVENFIIQQNKYALADISVDLNAWDLKELDKLEMSFAKFVQQLIDCFNDPNSLIYKQLKRILIQIHWQCQTYMYQQNIDLGDFCQLLIQEIESLKTELSISQIKPLIELEYFASEILEKINNCIILTGFSGGKYQFSNGISLFFPWSLSSYKASQESYELLYFVKKSLGGKLWNDFLKIYLSEISLREAKPLSSINQDGTFNLNEDGSIVYQSFLYKNELATSQQNALKANTKIPEEGTEKIPEEGTEKIPEEGAEKIPEEGTEKIPEEGTEKIPEEGTEKIPEEGAEKLGSTGIFFSKFLETRNTQTFWNRSGFKPNKVSFFLKDFNQKKVNENELNIANQITMEYLHCNDKLSDKQKVLNSSADSIKEVKNKKPKKKKSMKK